MSGSVSLATLVALVLINLWLLQGPVRSQHRIQGPLMPTDVHVTVAELAVDPYPLPTMQFRRDGPGYVPASDEYMAVYPDDLYRYYAAADVRRADNSVDYYTAAAMLFGGLLLLMATGRRADR